jgi:hypothetical protein
MRKTKEEETCKQQEWSHTLLMWAQDKNSAQATAKCKNQTQNFRGAFLVNHLHKNEWSVCVINSLALNKQTVHAVGAGGHCYAHLKGKQQVDIKRHKSWMLKRTFLSKFWSKNDQSFCTTHNVMIQETLYMPGGKEKAFLVLQQPWREVSWWWRKSM